MDGKMRSRADKILAGLFAIALASICYFFISDLPFPEFTRDYCLEKWHDYTTQEEMGSPKQWTQLEKCLVDYPEYKRLFEKYAIPKGGEKLNKDFNKNE